jgi:Ca2+-binding RTX toxin-like protein
MLAPTAEASQSVATTVPAGTVLFDKEGTGDPAEVWFVATPGVANRITVTEIDTASVEITDTAGPLVIDLDCTRVNANTARCYWVFRVRIYAGDGDDIVNAPVNLRTSLYGGPGNDTLTGGHRDISYVFGGDGNDTLTGGIAQDYIRGEQGNDTIDGGAGDDYLYGGTENDTVHGGLGNDTILEDAGRDVLDGGSGIDEVNYDRHPAGVTVTLDGAANDGRPGELDNVQSTIEDVTGTRYNDKLVGNGTANHLSGLEGNDQLYGYDGNDVLDALDGPGYIDGGPGSDTCTPVLATVTRVNCSP